MNIGIDIDDTISETYATLLEYAQKYTIEELKRSPIIKSFNTEDHLYIENMHNWNENETARFWKEYYEEIIKKVNIKTFAANIIKELKESGDKIFLITARWNLKDNNIEQITKDWLKENNVEYDKLIINAKEKLKFVKENNIEIFIDDSCRNCKDIAYNSNAKVFIMDTRVNQNLEDEKITRVYSWPHLYKEIKKLKEEN